MGQQQLLFLILGVCIIGIAISAGSIALQSDHGTDHRHKVYSQLKHMALEAQLYYRRSFEDAGGDGTFRGLTATPHGISKLTFTPSTPFGEFYINKDGNPQCVQIIAVGHTPGNDPSKPIKMVMTVYAETSSVAVLN